MAVLLIKGWCVSGPRVVLLEVCAERTRETKVLLAAAGCEVVATLPFDSDVVKLIPHYRADLLLTSVQAPAGSLFAGLTALQTAQRLPLVVMSAEADTSTIQRSVQAGVCAYVVDGVQPDRLQPILIAAIARYQRMRSLSDELDKTRLQLSERKIVERAKGIIMMQRDVSEEQAYRLMRTVAMDRNKRLADVAQSIVAATDLLDAMAPLSPSGDAGDMHNG